MGWMEIYLSAKDKIMSMLLKGTIYHTERQYIVRRKSRDYTYIHIVLVWLTFWDLLSRHEYITKLQTSGVSSTCKFHVLVLILNYTGQKLFSQLCGPFLASIFSTLQRVIKWHRNQWRSGEIADDEVTDILLTIDMKQLFLIPLPTNPFRPPVKKLVVHISK